MLSKIIMLFCYEHGGKLLLYVFVSFIELLGARIFTKLLTGTKDLSCCSRTKSCPYLDGRGSGHCCVLVKKSLIIVI